VLLVDKGRALRAMAGATPEQRAAPYEAEGLRMTFDPSQGLFEVAVDACLGLTVTALLYGVLTSKSGPSLIDGRASSEELLARVAFTVSINAFLDALVLLISISGLPASGSEARAIVTLFVPAIAMAFLAGGLMVRWRLLLPIDSWQFTVG